MLVATPEIGRRRVLITGLASATALLLPSLVRAQEPLVLTPRQTAGPFYPVRFPADVDNDLVVVRGARPEQSASSLTSWDACSARMAGPSQRHR